MSTLISADNESLVFAPLSSKDDLQEKLLVLIPGANVATEFYNQTVTAVQSATNLKLWVVVPAMPNELCISQCPTAKCGPLKILVDASIQAAVTQGYAGKTSSPDVFMSGHSLGGTCADKITRAMEDDEESKYESLVLMGSYVDKQHVSGYNTPVFTLGAELDGGLGRPGMLYKSMISSDSWANENGGIGGAPQIENKPVVIIPGIDHSDFCPGFRVPGDVYPSDVSSEQASTLIAEQFSAWLHMRSSQPDEIKEEASARLTSGGDYTRNNMLGPLAKGLEAELSDDGMSAPWCEEAQALLVGFTDIQDTENLNIISVYKNESKPFEDTRVAYETLDDGHVQFNISGYNKYYSLQNQCFTPAKELGCKMASADRVAQQLNLTAGHYNDSLTCEDINKKALDYAIHLLGQTTSGANAYQRFLKRGRPICFGADYNAPGNAGPLFVKQTMKIQDSDDGSCLEVASLKLGPQGLKSPIFPGVHYCKLASPARFIDYIMIDSLKNMTSCLNKDSEDDAFAQIFLQ